MAKCYRTVREAARRACELLITCSSVSETVIVQSRALVRVIKALDTIERAAACLLVYNMPKNDDKDVLLKEYDIGARMCKLFGALRRDALVCGCTD